MSQKWFKDESPEIWALFRDYNVFICDGFDADGEPINLRPKNPEAIRFFTNIDPWERHIPVNSAGLEHWKKELPYHKDNSYGKILSRDIRLAEECNARGSEMIISFKRTATERISQ